MKNVDIRRLNDTDINRFIELIRLFEIVFEMEDFTTPNTAYLQSLLNKETFNVFVAQHNNQIVGGLTTYTLEQYYSTQPLAYIYDLAVDPTFQRKGIGQKLIEATKSFYKENGFEEVFVQADKVDDYALDFYRKTNPTDEEDVSHFYYKLD
ncbi:MAG: GNAT family N-acetyltransferase [Bacteroidia bacterium]|nr:GNAT family N-acetyltransferase [Bacteroidia bacterium]